MNKSIECNCCALNSPERINGCLEFLKGKKVEYGCLVKMSDEIMYYMSNENFDSKNSKQLQIVNEVYKIRHDMLFHFLTQTNFGTDHKFPYIESNKTPDLIFEENDKITVVEFTSSSDYERGVMSKGGFEKEYYKYNTEIKMLEDLGKTVDSILIIWEIGKKWVDQIDGHKMSKFRDIDENEFNTLSEIWSDLDKACNYLSVLVFSPYNEINENIVKQVDSLMGKIYINKDEVEYSLIAVSNQINSILNKFKVKNYKKPDSNFDLIINLMSNNIEVRPVRRGRLLKTDWDELEKGNWPYLAHKIFVKDGNKRSLLSDFKTGEITIINYAPIREDYTYNLGNANAHQKAIYEKEMIVEERFIKIAKLENTSFNILDLKKEDIEKLENYKLDDEKTSTKLLSNYVINDKLVDESLKALRDTLIEKNTIKDNVYPPIIKKPKTSFQLPMIKNMFGTAPTGEKLNFTLIDFIIDNLPENYLLKRILNKYKADEYKPCSIDVDRYDEVEVSRKRMNESLIVCRKKLVDDQTLRFLKENDDEDFLIYRKDQLKYYSLLKKYKIDKRPCLNVNKKRLDIKNEFKNEMKHFGMATGLYGRGIDNVDLDLNELENNIKSFFEEASESNRSLGRVWNNEVGEDVNILKKTKEMYMEEYEEFYKIFENTFAYNTALLMERFCKSLYMMSTYPLRSGQYSTDNLGLQNTILIVDGGPKIYKTKSSKLFRMIYPTYDGISSWISSNEDWNVLVFRNVKFIITPWMRIHVNILMDKLSICHQCSLSTITLSSRVENKDIHYVMNEFIKKMLLGSHGRRKTEEMLYNLRYVLVNLMGDFSAFKEIIGVFGKFCYSNFEAFLSLSILHNLKMYFNDIKKLLTLPPGMSLRNKLKDSPLTDIIWKSKITNEHEISFLNYTSYMLTKSPTHSSIEQSNTLYKILGVVNDFKDYNNLNTTEEYIEKTSFDFRETDLSNNFKHDLFFDRRVAYISGKLIAGLMDDKPTIRSINNIWSNVINKSWDCIGNNKGLRGDEGKFFGEKSYEVVFKKVLKNEKDLLDNIPEDFSRQSKYFNQNKITIFDKAMEYWDEDFKFGIVDKEQRGGSREIYIMDYKTKVRQHIIEDFMSSLSRFVPNEVISISSNKRMNLIHHKLFETETKRNDEIYYLTLDCKRWGPHSNFVKFIYFIMGMSKVLPKSSVYYMISFFINYHKKYVYVKENIYKIIERNPNRKEALEILEYCNNDRCYRFKKTFSWMMGMFNFLSSIMHAGNQLLIKSLLQNKYAKLNLRCELSMFAHSDDSGGRLCKSIKIPLKDVIDFIEILLRSCNHMLSIKKCLISKIYFEFLSILYLNRQLIPLLPKFIYNLGIKFSGEGIYMDYCNYYSKVIEFIQFGASLSESYLAGKMIINLVSRMYNVPERKDLIPQLCGAPDAHPLMVLACGSNSDLIRLSKNDENIRRQFEMAMLLNNFDNREILVNPVKFSHYQTPEYNFDFIPNEDWTFRNVKFDYSFLNLHWFGNQLKKASFRSAFRDDSALRRLARSIYIASNPKILSSQGYLSIKDYLKIVDEIKEVKVDNNLNYKILQVTLSELKIINDYLDKVESSFNVSHSIKTCKPCHVNIAQTFYMTDENFDHIKITSWIKEPNYRSYLNYKRYPRTTVELIDHHLKSIGINIEEVEPDKLSILLAKFSKYSQRSLDFYGYMPSDKRHIDNISTFLDILSENSFVNKIISISKVAIPVFAKLGSNLVVEVSQELSEFWDAISVVDSINTVSDLKDIVVYKSADGTAKKLLEEKYQKLTVSEKQKYSNYLDNKLGMYWYWVKRQKFVGGKWVGLGILYINLINLSIVMEIHNERLSQVEIFGDKQIDLEQSNFLQNNIFSKIHLRTESSLIQQKRVYFGRNKITGLYDICESTYLSECCLNTLYVDIDKYKVTEDILTTLSSGDKIFYRKGVKYTIHSHSETKIYRIRDVGEFIDLDDPVVCTIIRRSFLQIFLPKIKRFQIDPKINLAERFSSTLLFSVLCNKNLNSSFLTLLNDAIIEKKIYGNEISKFNPKILLDQNIEWYSIPKNLRDVFIKEPNVELSQFEKNEIRELVYKDPIYYCLFNVLRF